MGNAENGLYLPPIKKWKLRKILFVEYLILSGFGSIHLNTTRIRRNKAGYTATLVACGWAGAVIEKVTGAFGQEQ